MSGWSFGEKYRVSRFLSLLVTLVLSNKDTQVISEARVIGDRLGLHEALFVQASLLSNERTAELRSIQAVNASSTVICQTVCTLETAPVLDPSRRLASRRRLAGSRRDVVRR